MKSGNPFLSPKHLVCGHLMKIEWLMVNMTAVGTTSGQETNVFGLILAFLGQIRPLLCNREAILQSGDPILSPRICIICSGVKKTLYGPYLL